MRTNEEVLGEATGIYTDMFGIEYKVYDNSKRYFITNVGPDRELLHFELTKSNIEILELNGIFGYIELFIETEVDLSEAKRIVSSFEGCSIHRDVG